jgi:hypothetical protein
MNASAVGAKVPAAIPAGILCIHEDDTAAFTLLREGAIIIRGPDVTTRTRGGVADGKRIFRKSLRD